MNKQNEQTQSRQDRNLLRFLWRQSGDTRNFQTWRLANLNAMEVEAEQNRLRYGPWTTAETRIWQNEEESAALVQRMEAARNVFREEEQETIQYLGREQARARQEQVALREAEVAAMTALERQQESAARLAESSSLDRISATCRGWMVRKYYLHD